MIARSAPKSLNFLDEGSTDILKRKSTIVFGQKDERNGKYNAGEQKWSRNVEDDKEMKEGKKNGRKSTVN